MTEHSSLGPRIVFIGDSITHAFRQPDEKNPAFQLGNGFVFLLASAYGLSQPKSSVAFVNRGVCGEGIRHLAARWESDCLALNPSLVTVLVGVNDTIHAMRGASTPMPTEFCETMIRLLNQLNGVPVVVLEPFLVRAGEVDDRWLTHIEGTQAAARQAAGAVGATFVPLQEAFDRAVAESSGDAARWAWDGIHPTERGFALIAAEWTRAAGGLIPVREAVA